MSSNTINITLEADASGAIRVIKQVSTSVDQLAGKKVAGQRSPAGFSKPETDKG